MQVIYLQRLEINYKQIILVLLPRILKVISFRNVFQPKFSMHVIFPHVSLISLL
jgi:hypothetical protein